MGGVVLFVFLLELFVILSMTFYIVEVLCLFRQVYQAYTAGVTFSSTETCNCIYKRNSYLFLLKPFKSEKGC